MAIWLGFRVFLPAVHCTMFCGILIFFIPFLWILFLSALRSPCGLLLQSVWMTVLCISSQYFVCVVLFFFSGIVGLQHPGVLVHRATWAEPAVPGLDLWRAAQLLLDDRLLQPAGLPDSHETGTHGIRLPTCLPNAGEETRWHAEGQAGTQPHSHTQASLQPYACTNTHTYTRGSTQACTHTFLFF